MLSRCAMCSSSVAEHVIDGEPDNAGQGLRVEEHDDAGDVRRGIGISESVSSRPRASRRSSSLSGARRVAFIAGMDRERRQCRLCMAQLRKALKQVRLCSLFSAHQASMSIWDQEARVVFRSPNQLRNEVACLPCSAAKRRTLGVMWLCPERARSRGRTRQVVKSRIVLTCSGSSMLVSARRRSARRAPSRPPAERRADWGSHPQRKRIVQPGHIPPVRPRLGRGALDDVMTIRE